MKHRNMWQDITNINYNTMKSMQNKLFHNNLKIKIAILVQCTEQGKLK